eukprot:3941646-Rhodomonas_salina.1
MACGTNSCLATRCPDELEAGAGREGSIGGYQHHRQEAEQGEQGNDEAGERLLRYPPTRGPVLRSGMVLAAMGGTALAEAAISLHACCAMSGTDLHMLCDV